VSGNAFADGIRYGGWFVGHFVAGGDLRCTRAVEVKVTTYRGKEARPIPAANRTASTLVVLILGRIRLQFPERDVLLRREGDYALWPPGIPHRWVAEAASRVITIRWPSRPSDQVGGLSQEWGKGQPLTREKPALMRRYGSAAAGGFS
jgi:quercetin dioxygenase-like cupin family protein